MQTPKPSLSYGELGGIHTPDLIGYKRRLELEREGPIVLGNLQARGSSGITPIPGVKIDSVNGYKMIPLPSPSPNEMKSPLITWGEISSTPIRVEDEKTGYRVRTVAIWKK